MFDFEYNELFYNGTQPVSILFVCGACLLHCLMGSKFVAYDVQRAIRKK